LTVLSFGKQKINRVLKKGIIGQNILRKSQIDYKNKKIGILLENVNGDETFIVY